jgi:hypothetical protein
VGGDGGAEKKQKQNKTEKKRDRIQQTRLWRATATSSLVRAIPLLRSFFSRAPIAVRAKVWLTDIFVFAGLALTSLTLHWPIRALAPQPTPAPAPSPRRVSMWM